MSAQLRDALNIATFNEVDTLRQVLTDAADLADLDSAPHALLFRSLLDDIDAPAQTYRTALVAATVRTHPAAKFVVEDLLMIDCPLAYALARELSAAARLGQDMQTGFQLELANGDTVPEDWK